jgi:hypothetical protein
MNVVAMLYRATACALLVIAAGSAFAADPATRKKGEPATFTGSSFGQLVTKLTDDDTVTASFDNDGKLKVNGNMNDAGYVGFWTASSYWGKVKFEMSDFGRTYTGKWGYCDAEPDVNFQAKWDGN